MKRDVLLILVGGTICTNEEPDTHVRSINGNADGSLRDTFNKTSAFAEEVVFSATENLEILSENMTVEAWNDMISLFRKYTCSKKYDGIVFVHGTDSLAYSSSLFSMLLADTKIPIFFVSSNEPLSYSTANGHDNFRCAVECICRGITPNVYVTYRNTSDAQMYLHLGSRLKQCANYSEDFFSDGAINITDISDKNYKDYFSVIDQSFPQQDKKSLLSIYGDWSLKNSVLLITPYVGLRYDAFDYGKYSVILHGVYHSGTVCEDIGVKLKHKLGKQSLSAEDVRNNVSYIRSNIDDSSVLVMIDSLIAADVDIYFSPAEEWYESMLIVRNYRFEEKPRKFLFGETQETAYTKLLIAYSVFAKKDDIEQFLDTEINFEKCHKRKTK